MCHLRHAVAAAATLVVLALASAAGAQQPLTASFEFTPAAPQPGGLIDLHATSTSSSTVSIRHSWDLDGDGQFDDATGDAVRTSFAVAGSYLVRVKAIQVLAAGSSESVAERTIVVGTATGPPPPPPPPPPPAGEPGPGNQPPVAGYDKKCTKVGTLFFCPGLAVRE